MPKLGLVKINDGERFTDSEGFEFSVYAPRWWEIGRWFAWWFWLKWRGGAVIEATTPGGGFKLRVLFERDKIADVVEYLLEEYATNGGGELTDERRERLWNQIEDECESDG